jgi:hypothetical protein
VNLKDLGKGLYLVILMSRRFVSQRSHGCAFWGGVNPSFSLLERVFEPAAFAR